MPFQITPSQAADLSLAHSPWQVSKHFLMGQGGLFSCNPGSATSFGSVVSALHLLIYRSREVMMCVALKGCCGSVALERLRQCCSSVWVSLLSPITHPQV